MNRNIVIRLSTANEEISGSDPGIAKMTQVYFDIKLDSTALK